MQVYIQGIEAIGMSLGPYYSMASATTFGQQRLLDLIPLPLMMREDAGTPTGDYTTGTGSLLYLHLELLPSYLLVVASQPWLLPSLLPARMRPMSLRVVLPLDDKHTPFFPEYKYEKSDTIQG